MKASERVRWNQDSGSRAHYVRLGIFGVQIEPSACGWRADWFFWARREAGGPCLGHWQIDDVETVKALAIQEAARHALAPPCSCSYLGHCGSDEHRVERLARGRPGAALSRDEAEQRLA